MIVTYDRFLEVRQPFTDQLALLRGALGALRKESGLATIRNRDRSWTNLLTFGLLDRPEVPPPIELRQPGATATASINEDGTDD